ncbi:ABC transporter substrate-binding protein [Microbacterium halophytorum]|uniref:ABC transporter substrate-binding protein n=1 Tax=Microbacterium halophytorum TaxID=2067568 RepID=UPI000CFC06AC|nr:sugar ABC transporter substrate-binding protein [Microbacterium halophytorum]
MKTTPARSALRRAAAITAVGAVALGLAACSGGGAGGAVDAEEIPVEGVDDGSTLTLWTRAPIEAQAHLLVDAYNETHENQVELTVVPNDDYVAKVGAAAGSGELPDLFAADVVYVPNWADQGLFADMAPLIDGLDYADQINEGHMRAGTIDDAEYTLPFVLDLSVMMWNKDLVEQAGFDPEQAPETLADFAEIARAVDGLGLDGVSGTATGLNCGGCLVFTWFPSVWASGEEVLSEDGTESLLDAEVPAEIYDTWRGLAEDGVLAPGSEDETGATWVAAFQEGKVGIMPYPATLLPALEFDAGVAGIPGVDGGASTFVGGDSIGISKDSELAPQAWNFLSWLMSEDAQVDVLAAGGNAVSRADLTDNEYASEDPRLVAINEVATQGSTPVARNFQQAFNAVGSPWVTLVRNAVLGDGGTLEDDNALIDEILAQ